MENGRTGSGPTSPLYLDSSPFAVRISDSSGVTKLLGTGTLLIRKRDRTVWLLTCAHVLFPKEDENPRENVVIEYTGIPEIREQEFANISGRRRTLNLIDEESGKITERFVAGKPRYPEETASDFVCFRLDWEDWMGKLPDTVFCDVAREDFEEDSDKFLRGYGFPNRANKEYGRTKSLASCICDLKCNVIIAGNGEINVHYEGYDAESRDEQSLGFSGTGLFNKLGELAGLFSCPRGEGEGVHEAKLFPAILVKESWERLEKRFQWEEISLIWMVRNPTPRLPLLPYLHQRANLFCLINGIQGAAALFLLNHRGEKLNGVLRDLSAVVPGRAWTSFSVTQGGEFDPKDLHGQGVIVFLRFRRRDWDLTRDFLKKRWREENCLLLFSVDISPSSEQSEYGELVYETPGKDDLRLICERIPLSMQDKPYYLLMTACFVDQNFPLPLERQEELLRRAEDERDPCGFLVRELEACPSAFYSIMSACARSRREVLRVVGCRLAIGYWRICGQSPILNLFNAEGVFLRDLYSVFLNGTERMALLGQLTISESNEADTMLNTVLEEDDNYSLEYLHAIDKCAALSHWTEIELEPCLLACLQESSHAAFDLLLVCLNEYKRQEEDYETLLVLLERFREEGTVTDRSYYWKTLLCSRWGTEYLPKRLEGSGIPAQLLDPWPDTKDETKTDYAATVRKKILPMESWLTGGAVEKGVYSYDLL